MQLALHEANEDELKADPVASNAWSFLRAQAPLRPGEKATFFRFWMDADRYHNISRVQSRIFVSMVRHYLTTHNLAYSFLPITKPLFWKILFNYADLHRIKQLNFKVNQRSFGVYGHDWRSRPPAAWLDLLASREIWGISQSKEEPEYRQVIVLSEETFTSAVRDALKNFTRPGSLKTNPLIDSKIVADKAEQVADLDERVVVLTNLLREAIHQLGNDPKQEKAYRAIDRTYVRPAGSQEQVSEMLGVPYSTFRRHLTHGVSEIAELLWQREIGQ